MVDRKRFSDSSISIADHGRIYDESLSSSAEICLYDHPALAEVKKSQAARYRVYMTRLEPRVRVYDDEKLTNTIAYSREVAECEIADGLATVAECLLFDASSVGQIMCLGVGRFPHNLLRPFVGDDVERYYENPDVLDPGGVCGQISRDHGLVFLDRDGKIRYRDFGTKKVGGRAGSKNGTWIDGAMKIQNAVTDWQPNQYLGLGGRVWVRREGELVKEHVFKLRYDAIQETKSGD
jgi:hypothetical protein